MLQGILRTAGGVISVLQPLADFGIFTFGMKYITILFNSTQVSYPSREKEFLN